LIASGLKNTALGIKVGGSLHLLLSALQARTGTASLAILSFIVAVV
jgi:hypothetical protein